MSYFLGDDGKKYHPFGKGGRDNLLKGFNTVFPDASKPFATVASPMQKDLFAAVERLRHCPLISFPLSADNASPEEPVQAEGNGDGDDRNTLAPDARQSQPDSFSPVSMRLPESKSALLYSELSDHVVNELFKLQIDVFTVSFPLVTAAVVLEYPT
jgi:hypothetical protein